MTTLKIKWSNLTKEQRKQATDFYKDDIKEKRVVANQMIYSVNPLNGLLVFNK